MVSALVSVRLLSPSVSIPVSCSCLLAQSLWLSLSMFLFSALVSDFAHVFMLVSIPVPTLIFRWPWAVPDASCNFSSCYFFYSTVLVPFFSNFFPFLLLCPGLSWSRLRHQGLLARTVTQKVREVVESYGQELG
jgi:hypothetical protein